VEGLFERHVSPTWVEQALLGSSAGGRWAAPGTFPVIYLGRPVSSVVVEAYRHLVDGVEGMTAEHVRGRRLVRARVAVDDVLDLRGRRTRLGIGLGDAELFSEVGDYDACRRLGHAAHEAGLHGVIAPAATRLGETLALFVDHLAPEELPVRVGKAVVWRALPPDPRRRHLVRAEPAEDRPSASL
jgi:RES domain-containing protein